MSGFDKDIDKLNCHDGTESRLSDRGNNVNFAKTVLRSFDRLFSVKMKPLGHVGGGVSADAKPDGSTEVNAEAHISTTSDDGKTSVTASGEATVDNQGNCSGKIEVRVEHEF
jgi:hypothetical protein